MTADQGQAAGSQAAPSQPRPKRNQDYIFIN
nr:MAG TPA: hypothetical protein [Caudoviricetes sp.]